MAVQTHKPRRRRTTIEHDIVETCHRQHAANRHDDFDAYCHLTEQIHTLLGELAALDPPTTTG